MSLPCIAILSRWLNCWAFLKTIETIVICWRNIHMINARQWRSALATLDHLINVMLSPSKDRFDTTIDTVAHPAPNLQCLCLFGYPTAKPDTLNTARYDDVDAGLVQTAITQMS